MSDFLLCAVVLMAGSGGDTEDDAMKAPFKTPVRIEISKFGHPSIVDSEGNYHSATNHIDFQETAINSHEALVEALEMWVDHDGKSCFLFGVDGWCGECAKCTTLKILALAKGESK